MGRIQKLLEKIFSDFPVYNKVYKEKEIHVFKNMISGSFVSTINGILHLETSASSEGESYTKAAKLVDKKWVRQ